MKGPRRLADGGRIDRERPLSFTFDGRSYRGFEGDTLASALLANGVRTVARSLKYHRPRGLMSAGLDEPNGLLRVGTGANAEPNALATRVALFEGLIANSQNRWPSLAFDFGAVMGLLSPLLPTGFYYKTFLSRTAWEMAEPLIRRAAGLGTIPHEPDPDRYETRHAHADVLVIGAGPAGLSAALAAARTGARVMLVGERGQAGGRLLSTTVDIDGAPAEAWVADVVEELANTDSVTLLFDATAIGAYHHNLLAVAERLQGGESCQRLWKIRARQVVLAQGAFERPLLFPDNDRPGIMLGGAVATYLHQFAVLCGQRAVIATNNDSPYSLVEALIAAGAEVPAIIDSRPEPGDVVKAARGAGVEVFVGHHVVKVHGRSAVSGVGIATTGESKPVKELTCDLLSMSGGWNPAVHLFSQAGGKLAFRAGAFVPECDIEATRSAGAGKGTWGLRQALAEGLQQGAAAAAEAGFGDGSPPPTPRAADTGLADQPLPCASGRGRVFIDFATDVTAADVTLAAREGYRSIEHLKRYTALGMGPDQGKIGNILGLALLAANLDRAPADVGTTTFRPPFVPTTVGTMVGRRVGHLFHPKRRTSVYEWHARNGAVFLDVGGWKRPQFYRQGDETDLQAVNREVLAVRAGAGVVDVATLGKIEITGADTAEFLDRVYTNNFASLPIGKARYGLMLREDGMVFDDGVTSRLDEQRYFMTTTTGGAANVYRTLEFYRQVRWPELRVILTPITDQWFALALSGPKSRRILGELVDDMDVSDSAFPMMGAREGTVAGVSARVFRLSFSGELSYEIYVPADFGTFLWQRVIEAGAPHGLVPYGVEAMSVLRIEKGHVASGEIDGRTTPHDLGLDAMLSRKKAFIGQRSLSLPALAGGGRKRLVGLRPIAPLPRFPTGGQVVAEDRDGPQPILGHITSHTYSPHLKSAIALALVVDGPKRHGDTLYVSAPMSDVRVAVRLEAPDVIDPDGARLGGLP